MFGVIDSGIGGLTVWREVVKLLPGEDIVYYADSANCPYGNRTKEEITTLTDAIVGKLIDRGVGLIVLACNTMTAAAVTYLREKYPHILFVGMEPAVKPAVQITKSNVIGILATRATLSGEHYHRTVDSFRPRVEIVEQAGEGLVEFIERGEVDSPQCRSLIRSYIDPMVARGADCVVLGCTHYPFLVPVITDIYGKGLVIVDPAAAVARRVMELASTHGLIENSKPCHQFLTSGSQEDLQHIISLGNTLLRS